MLATRGVEATSCLLVKECLHTLQSVRMSNSRLKQEKKPPDFVTMATATKEMRVENLVESWRGYSNSVPVVDFFESTDKAAEMGRLTAKDNVNLAKIKH